MFLHKPFILLLIFISGNLFSQQLQIPLCNDFQESAQKCYANPENNVHTAFKPIVSADINYDSLQTDYYSKRKIHKYWLWRKARNEDFIRVSKDDFYLAINPQFVLEHYTSSADTAPLLYRNTRGMQVKGNIGKKVSFESNLHENQAVFPSYIDAHIRNINTVPGQGRFKNFKGSGVDFAFATGYFSYSPTKQFSIQAGNGKHFIGEGYRSMLLSDNAFNYPYLRLRGSFFNNKIQWNSTYASLIILERVPRFETLEAALKRKGGTFHLISYKPIKQIEISFFEGMIWERWRKDVGTLPPDWLFVNPIPGINTAINGFSGRHNSLMGLNLKVNPFKNYMLYAQLAFDDPSQKRSAYQMGIKLFDAFTLKRLSLQGEYNSSSLFTYSAPNTQSYTHYNEPMAHTLGAGFHEVIGIAKYNIKDFYVRIQYNTATFFSESYNEVTTVPDYSFSGNNTLNQNDYLLSGKNYPLSKLNIFDASLSYLLNPSYNMALSAGFKLRDYIDYSPSKTNSSSQNIIYLGFTTRMWNQYLDF